MEVKLARMEEKMTTVAALEAHIATLSQEVADSHSKIAAFEQAAAEARQRKLGPMAAVVPASLDKWAAMPKTPFSMPAFSVPSWGKRDPEPGEVAGGEVPVQRQGGLAEGAGDEDDASVGGRSEGMETKERGFDRRRELERDRALEDAQLEIQRQQIRVADLERKLAAGAGTSEGAEEAVGEDLGQEGLGAASKEQDRLVVMLRQQLSEAREARAAAEREAYSLRRELAAVSRDAAEEKHALVSAQSREVEQPEHRAEGGHGARAGGGGDLADVLLQLRMAREEVEGAHEAARVADAAANAAEKRARELEHERQADFDGYRERESKSREQFKALTDKLAQCEAELEQLKKKLWVKEREATVLQQQLDAARQGEGPSGSARADHGGWNSSALRLRAGDEMDELRRRLAATETVLAERTQRLRDYEEQLGVADESRWSKEQAAMPSGRAGRAATGSDRADGAHQPASLGPDVPAEGAHKDAAVAPEGGDGMDELDKREDVVAQREPVMAPVTSLLGAAGSEGVSAGRSQDRGLLSDLGSSVTNSVSGLTARSLGGWSAKLPFLGGAPFVDSRAQPATSRALSPGEPLAAAPVHPLAPPSVSSAPATQPQTPQAIGTHPVSASPSSNAGDGGVWGVPSPRNTGRARSGGRVAEEAEEAERPLGRSEGAGRKAADSGERWIGARGLVQDAVAESRAVRGFHHEREKEREAAAELAQIRSARGSVGAAGLRASTGFDFENVPGAAHAGGAPGARSSREWILTESSEEMMDRLRGRGMAASPEEQAEASLFLSQEWLDGMNGKVTSGKTASGSSGVRVSAGSSMRRSSDRLLDTRESNLWNRSAADVIPSVSSRA